MTENECTSCGRGLKRNFATLLIVRRRLKPFPKFVRAMILDLRDDTRSGRELYSLDVRKMFTLSRIKLDKLL